MYYCLLRELVYHSNLNYTKFRLAFLEVSSLCTREGWALVVDKVTVTSSTQNPQHGGGYRIA